MANTMAAIFLASPYLSAANGMVRLVVAELQPVADQIAAKVRNG